MKHKSISYAKWGYIFVAPFFIVFIIFNLYPLFETFRDSFYEYFKNGPRVVGPNWIGLDNYTFLFKEADMGKYFKNTFILWVLGFIPQIFFSLLFASWFTDLRMKLKTGAYKVIFYLPNVIMAAAMGMLFFTLFAQNGPVNLIYMSMTGKDAPYMFFNHMWSQRGVIALINFLMWYGNTTIMLMAAINGVDPSLYESAQIDGANPSQTFWKITIPLIRPILTYVLITSLIGGLQMYDVPQIITKNGEAVNRTSMTVIMFLQFQMTTGKNYGRAGAISVLLFIVAAILSLLVFMSVNEREPKKKVKKGGK